MSVPLAAGVIFPEQDHGSAIARGRFVWIADADGLGRLHRRDRTTRWRVWIAHGCRRIVDRQRAPYSCTGRGRRLLFGCGAGPAIKVSRITSFKTRVCATTGIATAVDRSASDAVQVSKTSRGQQHGKRADREQSKSFHLHERFRHCAPCCRCRHLKLSTVFKKKDRTTASASRSARFSPAQSH